MDGRLESSAPSDSGCAIMAKLNRYVCDSSSAKVALLPYFVGIQQVAGFPPNASFLGPCRI